MSGRPTLFLIAGPNGAGKSTFYETVLKSRIAAPFINADIIQRDELGEPDPQASYVAAQTAAERRDALIGERRSFVAETVFSHPSKIDLLMRARAAGFRLAVFHIHLATADLAIERVRARVVEGGHRVPEDKIRARYDRCGPLIRRAVHMADLAGVYDGSVLNAMPRELLRLSGGVRETVSPDLPAWFLQLYGDTN